MTPLETGIRDLVRLGLRGDTSSLRRYARQFLRKVAVELGTEHELSRELSVLLADDSVTRQVTRSAPSVSAGQADVTALVRVEEIDQCDRPVLASTSAAALDEITSERRSRDALHEAGIEPSRTVLMVGPPGVGKTMTARYLASVLELPLVSVDLGAVMSSYLGRSGRNLREAITFARQRECVFLIDEFDAVAKRRDDPSDIGELKRVVNLLLLELDQWPSSGLLLAATNHPELLDRAIWRRFDRVLHVGQPDATARTEILRREFKRYNLPVDEEIIGRLGRSAVECSGSDIARMVRAAVRTSVLDKTSAIALVEAELERRMTAMIHMGEEGRARFAQIAALELGWTQRRVAAALGVSHTAVGKMLRKVRKGEGSDPSTSTDRG